jgi:PIN domain nuclease of toxin-antitoxin system
VTEYVVDASAILAMLEGERGHDHVANLLSSTVISAVNLAEVVTGLINRGIAAEAALRTTDSIAIETAPFDRETALLAGALREATRTRGLSLGDRACLALARMRGLPALTADRSWAELDLGVEVRLIRGQ